MSVIPSVSHHNNTPFPKHQDATGTHFNFILNKNFKLPMNPLDASSNTPKSENTAALLLRRRRCAVSATQFHAPWLILASTIVLIDMRTTVTSNTMAVSSRTPPHPESGTTWLSYLRKSTTRPVAVTMQARSH